MRPSKPTVKRKPQRAFAGDRVVIDWKKEKAEQAEAKAKANFDAIGKAAIQDAIFEKAWEQALAKHGL